MIGAVRYEEVNRLERWLCRASINLRLERINESNRGLMVRDKRAEALILEKPLLVIIYLDFQVVRRVPKQRQIEQFVELFFGGDELVSRRRLVE